MIEEVWFAGVRSDLGGTFEDDPKLSAITLKWIVEGALDLGLVLKPNAYPLEIVAATPSGRYTVSSWIWSLLTYLAPPTPEKSAVHASVRDRVANNPHSVNGFPRRPSGTTMTG